MTRIRAAVAALILGIGAVAFTAAPAAAHNYLVSSTPAAGETLTALPESFEIRTNDALLDLGGAGAGFAFLVQDADGRYYGDGCVRINGPSMFATPALGEPGEYTVTWQVVSADGHTVSEQYTFTWAPEGEAPVDAGSAERPDCGGEAQEAPASESPGEENGAGIPADVWWIAGAAVALVVAIVLALVLSRRKA